MSDKKLPTLGHLKSGFKTIMAKIAQVSADTADAVAEMDAKNVDKSKQVAITIPTTGWVADTGDYPYRLDIAVSGVTTAHKANIYIDKDSIDDAVDCGMCPETDTAANIIKIWALTVPTASIAARYELIEGEES